MLVWKHGRRDAHDPLDGIKCLLVLFPGFAGETEENKEQQAGEGHTPPRQFENHDTAFGLGVE